MSQQNFPVFNFDDSPFNSQQTQGNSITSYQPWLPQNHRPNGSGRSFSQTYRTVQSMQNSNASNVTSFTQPTGAQESRIDPNLLLAVPGAQVRRPRSALDNSNPIARFYSEDAPWSSGNMRTSNTFSNRGAFSQPNVEYGTYREGPASVESLSKSDSGYYSHQTQSMIGGIEPEQCNQELPAEVILQASQITVNNSASSEPTEVYRPDNTDMSSVRSHSVTTGKVLQCLYCKEISKCKSDYKKHLLKHQKPFKCDEPNCRRDGKGFTTVNDLARHKKSVHRIGALDNSYQCASENCKNKEKIWPRLDNFKQHVHRMHCDEDELELIRKSVYHPPEPVAEPPGLSVAPMDTTLAGIGTEKQFADVDYDDNIPTFSLTPDQPNNPWNLDRSPSQDFAMDVDQVDTSMQNRDRYALPQLARPQSLGQDITSQMTPQSKSARSRSNGRTNSSALETLATAATSRAQPERSTAQPRPPPQVLRRPLTKADQRRHAMQNFAKKLARNIQKSSPNDSRSWEEAILRALGPEVAATGGIGSTHDTNAEIRAESGVLDPLNVPETQAKQSGKKAIGINTRPKPFSTSTNTCSMCDISLPRACDLKKHMKRHTRPYGCTYPRCHRRFGAKSDWKRHENSQHFQLESYRCQLPSSTTQTPCGEFFHRADVFRSHLQSCHRIERNDQLEHEIKMRRIGRNGQGQFWCGFCRDIIKLKEKRNAAWDERFNHIDDHFRQDKPIEEWLCLEARKTKGDQLREMNKNIFDEEDSEDTAPEDASPAESQNASQRPTTHQPTPKTNPRKRSAAAEPDDPRTRKRERASMVRFCCECSNGPFLQAITTACMECTHQFCPRCSAQSFDMGSDDFRMGFGDMTA